MAGSLQRGDEWPRDNCTRAATRKPRTQEPNRGCPAPGTRSHLTPSTRRLRTDFGTVSLTGHRMETAGIAQNRRPVEPRSTCPKPDAVASDLAQSDAAGYLVGRAGLEPATLGLRVPCTASCANGPQPFWHPRKME